ncbi:MAG: GGDEF domain-containing protein [Chloroflexi bacterium]|nr:GGDEF domain-containing protein [Chloroflexota bacterium]
MSSFKPLYARTGLIRRRPIEMRIDEIINRISTMGEGCISVAILDIDGFGRVEEQYGYHFADKLLDTIAQFLEGEEGEDVAARYVRDSFVLIYDGLPLEEAFLRAEAIRKQLCAEVFNVQAAEQEADIELSFSAGVATYPDDADDRVQLMTLADAAAKQALNSGGNRIAFGRPESMTPKTSHYLPTQLAQLRELRERLDRSEAQLLREALDDLLRKYDQRDYRRGSTLEEDQPERS